MTLLNPGLVAGLRLAGQDSFHLRVRANKENGDVGGGVRARGGALCSFPVFSPFFNLPFTLLLFSPFFHKTTCLLCHFPFFNTQPHSIRKMPGRTVSTSGCARVRRNVGWPRVRGWNRRAAAFANDGWALGFGFCL